MASFKKIEGYFSRGEIGIWDYEAIKREKVTFSISFFKY